MIMMASIFGLARTCRRGGPCTAEDRGATVSRATLNALDPFSAPVRQDTGTTLVYSTKHPVAPSRAIHSPFSARHMHDYQLKFIDLALSREPLAFGHFKLKSGRESPYFFNAGLFSAGASAALLRRCYAAANLPSGVGFDMVFAPAYK